MEGRKITSSSPSECSPTQPEGSQLMASTSFCATVPSFNTRVPSFNARVPSFNARVPSFNARVPSFNARVPLFNPRGPSYYPPAIRTFGPEFQWGHPQNYAGSAAVVQAKQIGELLAALEVQKRINRELESNLQNLRMQWEEQRAKLTQEFLRLQRDHESNLKLLSIYVANAPPLPVERYLLNELSKLTSVQRDAQTLILSIVEAIVKLKEQIINLNAKLNDTGMPVTEEKVAECAVVITHRMHTRLLECTVCDVCRDLVLAQELSS